MSASAEVVVGRIGRAHGLRGEVAVEVLTDAPEVRFADGADVHLVDRDLTLRVTRTRWHSGRLLVTFEQVADRTAAEALRGQFLGCAIDTDEAAPDDDEFFDWQLIGLPVRLADGADLGVLTEVVHLPGHDLLAVQTPAQREVLVPFVAQIVTSVDLDAGVVTIDPPSGLVD